MQDLDTVLAAQTPNAPIENTHLFELPPLVMDGIPTPLEKMTQVGVALTCSRHSLLSYLLMLDFICFCCLCTVKENAAYRNG